MKQSKLEDLMMLAWMILALSFVAAVFNFIYKIYAGIYHLVELLINKI